MKKIGVYGVVVAAAFALAPAAHAAQYLRLSGASGTFGADSLSGAFEQIFTFEAPADFQIASFDIKSIATATRQTNVDFTSVTFNGVEFNTIATGIQEFRNLLSRSLVAGTNEIRVRGVAGGAGAFSGTISFARGPAQVPEPATWAMLLAGFGVIGASVRRRKRASVTYA
jgi:hypothetical protein